MDPLLDFSSSPSINIHTSSTQPSNQHIKAPCCHLELVIMVNGQIAKQLGAANRELLRNKRQSRNSARTPNRVSEAKRPSGFLGLPQELRDQVYDILAEEEDFSSLMHTCRQFRFEILSRMPGGTQIDYVNPYYLEETVRDQVWSKLDISKVNIIAEPWYSPGSALKFEVKWDVRGQSRTCHRTSRWTVRDLSSPMARYIYLYQPRLTEVTFVAATSGYFAGAHHILRAKVFDICRILTNLGRPRQYELGGSLINHKLRIHFQGGKHPEDPNRLRKSFWEMRPGYDYSTKREVRERRWLGEVIRRRDYQVRETSPFFYESLMLPLFSCPPWLPSAVSFDSEPATKRSSFREDVLDMTHEDYTTKPYGAMLLFEQIRRHYFAYLRRMGFQNPIRAKQWTYEESSHDDRWQESGNDIVEIVNEDMEMIRYGLGGIPCSEMTQLRAYLLRMRHAPTCNPLAGDFVSRCELPRPSELPGPGDTVAPESWPFRGEDPWLKSSYIEWAENGLGGRHTAWDYKRTKDFVLYESLEGEPIGAMFDEERALAEGPLPPPM